MSTAAEAVKPKSKMTKAELIEYARQLEQQQADVEDPGDQAPDHSTDARDNPVILTKPELNTDDEQIGQDGVVEGSDDGPELAKPRPESIEAPAHKEKLANLAFNNEPIRIRISDTSEPMAQLVFEIAVNGVPYIIERGQEYVLPRYVVETIARAKPVNFRNEEYTDNDGIRKVKWPSRTGLRIPFEVIEDKNPMGRDWLRAILAQP